jgi:predicted RNase H-like HicB family nuclease
MKKFQLLTFVCIICACLTSHADDYEHSKGLPAETLEQALQNYDVYNQKLSDMLAQKLTPEAMHEIHMLSYTLENALERIEQVLEQHQEDLETIHKASEHMNADKVTEYGQKYLETSNALRQ